MAKPLLIGIANPHEGAEALSPWITGCSGWRLWKMMADCRPVTQEEYADLFDRTNLDVMEGEMFPAPSVTFLLGEEVRKAFKVHGMLIHPQVVGGRKYRCIPHPSGRNLFYNYKENRDLVAQAFLEEIGKW